jgi:flagellar assembly protein FliH
MTAPKFTFDTVFAGKKDIASDQARARQRLVFTQGEIDKMVHDARVAGLTAGEVRAREALAAAVTQTAAVVRDSVTRALTEIEAVRTEASQLAFAAARRLAIAALSHAPAEDVELALKQAMHQAIGEPRLVLRASPPVVEALSERIEKIAREEGFEGAVQIVADAAQHIADCRMEWRGGGAERSQAAIEAALAELIARHFSRSTQHSSPEA